MFAIPVSASVPFNVYVGKYLAQALGNFGIKTTYYSDTGETSQWVAGMNTAISEHVAAIDLIGMDPAAVAPQIAKAKAAGIPVIVDHFLDVNHTDYAGYKNVAGIVGAPYNLAGRLEAAWAIKETGGKGTFLVVQSPDLLSSTDVVVGIQAEMAKDCPSCHLVNVDVPFNDWFNSPADRRVLCAHREPGHHVHSPGLRWHGAICGPGRHISGEIQHGPYRVVQRGPVRPEGLAERKRGDHGPG